MTARPTARSGFARWGWIGPVVMGLFVLANIACLVWLNGGTANWVSIVICTSSGVLCHRDWRKAIDRQYATSQWAGR